ncbi:MAG TPA: hypothetical protein VE291_12195 [Terracidiphilus sp.]|nr:hypothetical protein [Terracidiphilus sp.]
MPLVLGGCTHRNQQALNQPLAPPIVDTPIPPPQTTPTELPPSVVTVQPAPQPATQTPAQKPDQKPRHPVRHPKPETKQPAEQASNANPNGSPEVSAIGELTPGDSPDQRIRTEQSIDAVDRGIKAIARPLNDQEQKTAAQIREFLKQARAALTAGDVDGAHTLAVKAKVLLDELNH